jgi:hypothetical protein
MNNVASKIVQIKSFCNGKDIKGFSDWEKYALPPERKNHWKEGRSEFELGRVWTARGEPMVPYELHDLFESHAATRGIVVKTGVTQHETTLPFARGGPRCHDLMLTAELDGGVVTICIESKADESFGGTLKDELVRARKRAQQCNRKTRFPERLDWLTCSLLGLSAFRDEQRLDILAAISTLPYQLLSAIAGTLLEAERQEATTAIFVVHEFRTSLTKDVLLEANADALNCFLRLLLSANNGNIGDLPLRNGEMIGPISIVERTVTAAIKMPLNLPLFIGKIRTVKEEIRHRWRRALLGVAAADSVTDIKKTPGEEEKTAEAKLGEVRPAAQKLKSVSGRLELGEWAEKRLPEGRNFARLLRAGSSPESLREQFSEFFSEVVDRWGDTKRQSRFEDAKLRLISTHDLMEWLADVKSLTEATLSTYRKEYRKQAGIQRKRPPKSH